MHNAHDPKVWFVVFLVIVTIRNGVQLALGASPFQGTSDLDRFTLGFIAACWVAKDARKRGGVCPTDQILYFTSLLVPVHILVTRKWRGVLLIVLLASGLLLTNALPILIQ
jgi:hypothetical protein